MLTLNPIYHILLISLASDVLYCLQRILTFSVSVHFWSDIARLLNIFVLIFIRPAGSSATLSSISFATFTSRFCKRFTSFGTSLTWTTFILKTLTKMFWIEPQEMFRFFAISLMLTQKFSNTYYLAFLILSSVTKVDSACGKFSMTS